jgi:hypothetical protein
VRAWVPCYVSFVVGKLVPRRNPNLNAVVGFAQSYDPESYAGGSVVTGRVSHAGQHKGDDAKQKGIPLPSKLWAMLGVGLTNCRSRTETHKWRRKSQDRDQWPAIVKEVKVNPNL